MKKNIVFILLSLFSLHAYAQANMRFGTATTDVNLRLGPSIQDEIRARLPKGSQLFITLDDAKGEWLYVVDMKDLNSGYVNSQYVKQDTECWDANKRIYFNSTYNLNWNLNRFTDDEWKNYPKESLPYDFVFMASINGDFTTVSLKADDKAKNMISIWKDAEIFADELSQHMQNSGKKQGITYQPIKYKKCNFLGREALFFEYDGVMYNPSQGVAEPINIVYEGYMFYRGDKVLIADVMVLKDTKESLGEDLETYIFSGLAYNNANAESDI